MGIHKFLHLKFPNEINEINKFLVFGKCPDAYIFIFYYSQFTRLLYDDIQHVTPLYSKIRDEVTISKILINSSLQIFRKYVSIRSPAIFFPRSKETSCHKKEISPNNYSNIVNVNFRSVPSKERTIL